MQTDVQSQGIRYESKVSLRKNKNREDGKGRTGNEFEGVFKYMYQCV